MVKNLNNLKLLTLTLSVKILQLIVVQPHQKLKNHDYQQANGRRNHDAFKVVPRNRRVNGLRPEHCVQKVYNYVLEVDYQKYALVARAERNSINRVLYDQQSCWDSVVHDEAQLARGRPQQLPSLLLVRKSGPQLNPKVRTQEQLVDNRDLEEDDPPLVQLYSKEPMRCGGCSAWRGVDCAPFI